MKRGIGLHATTLARTAKSVVFALRSPPIGGGAHPCARAALDATSLITRAPRRANGELTGSALLDQPTRRTFIKRLALGCACVLGAHTWQTSTSVEQNTVLLLARRIVRIVGAPAIALPVLAHPASDMAQQLAQLFDAPDFEVLLTLQDAQLKQLMSARIQQQYQQGALVLHHGWWLARSELVLLQLGAI